MLSKMMYDIKKETEILDDNHPTIHRLEVDCISYFPKSGKLSISQTYTLKGSIKAIQISGIIKRDD